MAVIALGGPIGAGKSSLTSILPKYLGAQPFHESVDNSPVLPLLYKDPKKYAFLLQVSFSNTRFHSIKTALTDDNNVLDRSIYKDSLFFHMNVNIGRATKEEAATYNELLDSMMKESERMPRRHPGLLVYTDVSYETTIERIQKRGRKSEQLDYSPTSEDYYKRLLSYYGSWYENYDYPSKIKTDGDKLDLMASEKDRQEVLDTVTVELKEMDKSPKDWTPSHN